MKVAAGFYASYLFFGVSCNEMFAHSLTFLALNSKSSNLNVLINFLLVVDLFASREHKRSTKQTKRCAAGLRLNEAVG